MYIKPSSVNEGDEDILVAVFYMVVNLLLKPFIYSLRNNEVINVVKGTMKNR